MPLLATCPTDPTHAHFVTSAHVAQDWKVDRTGAFIDVVNDCTDVTAKPQRGNTWQCCACGADAVLQNSP